MKLVARHRGEDLDVEVVRNGAAYRVRVGDQWVDADFVKVGQYVRSLRFADGSQFALVEHREGTTHEITLGGATVWVDIIDPMSARRAKGSDDVLAGAGSVRALMPGRVVRVMASKGQQVTRGTGLLILEAMKMENEIHAPCDGVVEELYVAAGQTVEAGAELVKIS